MALRALLVVGLLFLLSSCVQQTVSEETSAKIGAIVGLTGFHGFYGEEARNGMQLALDQFNAEHDTNIQLVVEDSQANPDIALSALQKMMQVDGIEMFITFSGASPALAMAPVANAEKVLQMELICYAPACHTEDDYLFRVSGPAFGEPYYMAQDLIDRGYKAVALTYINNDLGAAMQTLFSKKFAELGGTVVVTESYFPDTFDFRSILNKLVQDPQVEAIVVFSYGEIAHLIRQHHEMGIGTQIYAFEAVKSPETITVAGTEALQGILLSYPGNTGTATFKETTAAYESRYGSFPSIYALKGFDGMTAVLSAVESCEMRLDPECAKAYLHSGPDIDGAANKLIFDKFGDLSSEFYHTESFDDSDWIVVE